MNSERKPDSREQGQANSSVPDGELPTVSWHGPASSTRPAGALVPGMQIGNHRVHRLIAAGGMGEVYLAWHDMLGCQRAIKVLPARKSDDPDAVRRFRREVATLAQLQHPGIAAAIDAGEHEGRLYLVLEYVEGINLAQQVHRHGPLPVRQSCDYVRQVADALAYAHAQGVVHRDIKPSNLMLTPEQRIKVLDLGLARLMAGELPERAADVTAAGTLMGTVDYVAPEQARDAARADARSDLYSLGCTWYHLLAGHAPFADRHGTLEKLMAHAEQSPRPLSGIRPEVPATIAAIVERLLAKRPEDRFGSAAALRNALDLALEAGPSEEHRIGQAKPSKARRRWIGYAIAAVAVPALLIAMLVLSNLDEPETRPAEIEAVSVAVPPRLTQLSLILAPQGGAGPIVEHPLLVDGSEQVLASPQPVGRDVLFKIVGEFSEPTYWYLAWLDTAAAVQVEAFSDTPQTKVLYPSEDEFQSINPTDPAGVHWLMLLAGSLPPAEAKRQIESQLAEAGVGGLLARHVPPPRRGAGDRVSLNVRLPSELVEHIRGGLPPGVRLVQVIELETRP